MDLTNRLKHVWDVFRNRDPTADYSMDGPSSSVRPDRMRFTRGAEKGIVTAIYNRIALDTAAIDIVHVKLDEQGRFLSTMQSSLNDCLTTEANVDQSGRELIQDAVMSMLDEGVVGIVPTSFDDNPVDNGSWKIEELRVGKILEWKPNSVKLLLYNKHTGRKEEIWYPKAWVAIVENPFYAVMNEPNSTVQRLVRKMALLDLTDERTASGKLDLIIQLPYLVKTDARRAQAERRRKDIETQLTSSKYGIAYTDGTEHITQLNRSLENNLLKQVEYYTDMLFSQMGMTKEVLNGSADEKTMLNYYNRIIEPILSAIIGSMNRKFLSKTARSQRQTIKFFRDPFKLVPVDQIAEIADKFTRNEIATSNEIRQIIGWKPSTDPNADELRNKNLSAANAVPPGQAEPEEQATEEAQEEIEIQNDV